MFGKDASPETNPTEEASTLQYVSWRGVSRDTMSKFKVKTKVDQSGSPQAIVFPYGENASKIRSLKEKSFYFAGEAREAQPLFGMDVFSPGCANAITITEGELDCLSVYEMMGGKGPVVSIKTGASNAKRDCGAAVQYLNSFEKIYLCFDNDPPGQQAAKEVASLFDVNKVYFVSLGTGLKDANDYLTAKREQEFIKLWWNSKKYQPKGIVSSYADIASALEKKDSGTIASYPFPTLDQMAYGIRSGEVVLLTAQEKVGKQLALTTPLPTPFGWTTVGQLKVGDKLIGRDGKETTCTYITEVQHRPCYKVTFADGTSVIAGDEHRWLVRDANNNEKVLTTQSMFDHGVLRKNSAANFMVPSSEPFLGQNVSLPCDPYLFGVWLGDGHSYSANISIAEDWYEEFSSLGYTETFKEKDKGRCYSVRLAELEYKTLAQMGLLKNKHIPSLFLRASLKDREALFQGLIDTDGWNNKEFYSSNKTLFDQVVELARSLGYQCFIRSRTPKIGNKKYDTAWTMRFSKRSHKAIRSIVPVPSTPSKCLTVDNEDHLFLCGDGWTVTHNTEVCRAIEHHLIKNTDYNVGIIHLEEQEKRSVSGLVGYDLRRPVHLPDSGVSDSDIFKAYKEFTKREDKVYFYSHFGSDDPDVILDIVRYLVAVNKCKFIFLDHITMLVTGFEDDDERRKLDYISTRLAMMTRELDFTLFLVSHVNDNGQTRGSRNIAKIADLLLHIDRDKEHDDPFVRNTTKLVVRGNRYASHSGPAGRLIFDPASYTLSEIVDEAEAQLMFSSSRVENLF